MALMAKGWQSGAQDFVTLAKGFGPWLSYGLRYLR